MDDKMINILLMGGSGVGKSTLVNAIFDSSIAATGTFGVGKTKHIMIYNNDDLGYRVIDTKGLELGFFEQRDALKQVSDYIKDIIKAGDADAAIDVVWYCVDASSKRFYRENVKQIKSVNRRFPGVPVIMVLTKSYCSSDERTQNEFQIRSTMEDFDHRGKINLCDVVSVNSAPLRTANDDVVPMFGVDRLVDLTNEIMPEAKQISEANMQLGRRKLKNKQANITVGVCTTGAVAVGAVPIPCADAPVLSALQTGMVKAVTKIYGMDSSVIATAIIQASIVTCTAKLTISAIKAIPGLNVAGAVLNAIVAGVFTAAVGETTIIICEKIENGEINRDDVKQIEDIAKQSIPSAIEKMVPRLKKILETEDLKKLDINGVKRILKTLIKG